MTDEHRINEALAGHRDAEDRRRREVEQLAEKLFVAIYQGDRNADGVLKSGESWALWSFSKAEHFIYERDRRREVKR